MTLSSQANYPSTRSYVLKLHRDAAPHRGKVSGRLENMATGQHFDFNSGEELLACLLSDAAASGLGSSPSPQPSPIKGEGV